MSIALVIVGDPEAQYLLSQRRGEVQPHGDKPSFLLHAYGRRLIDSSGRIVGAGKGAGMDGIGVCAVIRTRGGHVARRRLICWRVGIRGVMWMTATIRSLATSVISGRVFYVRGE